jgi:hypothetical protein
MLRANTCIVKFEIGFTLKHLMILGIGNINMLSCKRPNYITLWLCCLLFTKHSKAFKNCGQILRAEHYMSQDKQHLTSVCSKLDIYRC